MAEGARDAGRAWTPYTAVLASRIRAQRAYPTSFLLDLFGSLLVGVVEFAEMWVIFRSVESLGGLDFRNMLLLFGLANLTFSVADLVAGHLDGLPTYIRAGTLDAFYLRPQPVLAQLMISDLALRRLTRIGVALVSLGLGLVVNEVPVDGRTIGLLVLSVVGGVAIFAGLFVCAAGMQFFLIDGAEFTNAFTYGGGYAGSQPTSVFPGALKVVFGFVIPVAFTAYLPTLAILELPSPAGFPGWLVWCLPLAAGWVWLIAMGLWRWGSRHYRGAGG